MTIEREERPVLEDQVEDEPGHPFSRVLRELLRTPVFRDLVALHLLEVESDAGRDVTRTLLRRDVNLSLGLVEVSPKYVEALLEAVLELGRQLNQVPSPLLDAFTVQVLEQLDADRFEEIRRVYTPLIERFVVSCPTAREKMLEGLYFGVNETLGMATGFLRAVYAAQQEVESSPTIRTIDVAALGELITLLARVTNRWMARRPRFFKELMSHVDMAEVFKTSVSMDRTLLRLILSVVGSLGGSIRDRFRRSKRSVDSDR